MTILKDTFSIEIDDSARPDAQPDNQKENAPKCAFSKGCVPEPIEIMRENVKNKKDSKDEAR